MNYFHIANIDEKKIFLGYMTEKIIKTYYGL